MHRGDALERGAELALYLPHISPISPLYLPYVSPISPLGAELAVFLIDAPQVHSPYNPNPDPDPDPETLTLTLTLTLTSSRCTSACTRGSSTCSPRCSGDIGEI